MRTLNDDEHQKQILVQHKCILLSVGTCIMILKLPYFLFNNTERVKSWRIEQAVRRVERESEFSYLTFPSCRILRLGSLEAGGGLRNMLHINLRATNVVE